VSFGVLFVTLLSSVTGQAAADPPPSGAKEIIARVNRAAKQQDYAALRANMAHEFTWSFGGDSRAEQAIAEWQKQPRYMLELARITRAKCTYRKDQYVECPASAGTSFRAGFKLTAGRWKMVYFVEGD